ncbi:MAG: hypothetical protein H7A51_13670 [Akkermansiaceae bacterium]|nr:hypothetical protein [Akkermansiaceae bacterium]
MSWKLKPFPEAFIDPKSYINNGISAMLQGNTEHEESIIIERIAQPPSVKPQSAENVSMCKTGWSRARLAVGCSDLFGHFFGETVSSHLRFDKGTTVPSSKMMTMSLLANISPNSFRPSRFCAVTT